MMGVVRRRHALPAGLPVVCSAGEPLNPEAIRWFRDQYGLTVLDFYGLTESYPLVANYPFMEVREGSMGRPMPGWDVQILDEDEQPVARGERGEICLRARSNPHYPLGYWNRPEDSEETFGGDWFHTKDAAEQDADGYYWYAGRADDVIISAGYRIGPFEVESACIEHPAVREAAAVASPDERRGHVVKAFIDPGRGARALRRAGRRDQAIRARPPLGLRVSAPDRVRRRAAEDADRQDPPDRAARARAAASRLTRFARPAVMGVLNVTPDSFSDGGRVSGPGRRARARRADGGRGRGPRSTSAGSRRGPAPQPVSADEELRRVMPVIEQLGRGGDVPVSIDTSKAAVARAGRRRGRGRSSTTSPRCAGIPGMAAVVARVRGRRVPDAHAGEPRTMQDDPRYDDVVAEVKAFLEERLAFAVRAGHPRGARLARPGIGFGKTLEHNLELLRRLDEIVALGRPVVVGASRKRFIGTLTGRAEAERVAGTVAANVMAFERGAHMFRVHDVAGHPGCPGRGECYRGRAAAARRSDPPRNR